MGCDIHMHVEIRQDNGSWAEKVARTGWSNNSFGYTGYIRNTPDWLFETRNYSVFGVLAGVKGTLGHTISKPRGLPVDCSRGVYERRGNHGNYLYHDTSWLTVDELVAFTWRPSGRCLRFLDSFFEVAVPALQNLAINPKNVRIVFWFRG